MAKKVLSADQIMQDENYHLVEEIPFGNVIPFILRNIKTKGVISAFYFGINTLSLLVLLSFSIVSVIHHDIPWSDLIKYSLLGIVAGTIFIIPVHESLHYLAYLIMGARKIKFGADPSQFIFYVVADRFPINRWQLVFLALAPFLIINIMVIIFLLPLIPHGAIAGGFLLLSHNVMCIGDFAMMGYALRKGNKTMITFDLVEENKSYIYIWKEQ